MTTWNYMRMAQPICLVVFFGWTLGSCAPKSHKVARGEALQALEEAKKSDPSAHEAIEAERLFLEGDRAVFLGQRDRAYRLFRDSQLWSRQLVPTPVSISDLDGSDLEDPFQIASPGREVPEPSPAPDIASRGSNASVALSVNSQAVLSDVLSDVVAPEVAPEPDEVLAAELKPVKAPFPEARRVDQIQKEGLSLVSEHDKRLQLDEKVALKERFPGVVVFSSGEVQFESVSQKFLGALHQRLQSEKQSQALFQAQVGDGEPIDLAKQRFEAIKSYLIKLGVEEPQIVLDDKRVVGEWPEMRVFILK